MCGKLVFGSEIFKKSINLEQSLFDFDVKNEKVVKTVDGINENLVIILLEKAFYSTPIS
jgi:hypothetical protein